MAMTDLYIYSVRKYSHKITGAGVEVASYYILACPLRSNPLQYRREIDHGMRIRVLSDTAFLNSSMFNKEKRMVGEETYCRTHSYYGACDSRSWL